METKTGYGFYWDSNVGWVDIRLRLKFLDSTIRTLFEIAYVLSVSPYLSSVKMGKKTYIDLTAIRLRLMQEIN